MYAQVPMQEHAFNFYLPQKHNFAQDTRGATRHTPKHHQPNGPPSLFIFFLNETRPNLVSPSGRLLFVLSKTSRPLKKGLCVCVRTKPSQLMTHRRINNSLTEPLLICWRACAARAHRPRTREGHLHRQTNRRCSANQPASGVGGIRPEFVSSFSVPSMTSDRLIGSRESSLGIIIGCVVCV